MFDETIERKKIHSANLSRIYEHRKNSKVGTISAFRSDLSEAENKRRDKALRNDMKKLLGTIGYIKIDGVYQEAQAKAPSKEISYFVYTIDHNFDLKSFLMGLGAKYGQDSIVYAPKDGSYEWIQTTEAVEDGVKILPGTIKERWNTTLFNKSTYPDGSFIKNYSKLRSKTFAFYNAKSADDVTVHQAEALEKAHTEIKSYKTVYPHSLGHRIEVPVETETHWENHGVLARLAQAMELPRHWKKQDYCVMENIKRLDQYKFKANEKYGCEIFKGVVINEGGKEFIIFSGEHIPTYAVLPIEEVELISKVAINNTREISFYEYLINKYRVEVRK